MRQYASGRAGIWWLNQLCSKGPARPHSAWQNAEIAERKMAEKLNWAFDRNLSDPKLRQARALEYIAHYLDRIDGHLELLAKSVSSGGVNEPLRQQLMQVQKILER